MAIRIGPCRVADARGTYEPGDVVEFPTADLVALATAKTVDPDSGELLCKVITASAAATLATPAPTPAVAAAPDVSKSAAAPVAPAVPEKT